MVRAMTRYGKRCHVMAKNSAEGNKARTARYRAGLAERGIRPVQLYAPEVAHALLRQAAGLMIREQDPLEPRQALRQASGANDPGQGHGDQDMKEGALAAAAVEVEAARAELTEARDAERQARQQVLAEAEAARAAEEGMTAALARAEIAERAQTSLTDKLRTAKAIAEQALAGAERFQKVTGLRSRMIRWLIR